MALGESVARRRQEARDGDEPRRQQRSHDAGGAGSARAVTAFAVTTSWSRPSAAEGLFSGGGIASRHPCRRGRETSIMLARYPKKRAQRSHRKFSFPEHRKWKRIIAGFRRSACAYRLKYAQDLASRRRGRRCNEGLRRGGENRSTRALARSGELLAEIDNFDVKKLASRPDSIE